MFCSTVHKHAEYTLVKCGEITHTPLVTEQCPVHAGAIYISRIFNLFLLFLGISMFV